MSLKRTDSIPGRVWRSLRPSSSKSNLHIDGKPHHRGSQANQQKRVSNPVPMPNPASSPETLASSDLRSAQKIALGPVKAADVLKLWIELLYCFSLYESLLNKSDGPPVENKLKHEIDYCNRKLTPLILPEIEIPERMRDKASTFLRDVRKGHRPPGQWIGDLNKLIDTFSVPHDFQPVLDAYPRLDFSRFDHESKKIGPYGTWQILLRDCKAKSELRSSRTQSQVTASDRSRNSTDSYQQVINHARAKSDAVLRSRTPYNRSSIGSHAPSDPERALSQNLSHHGRATLEGAAQAYTRHSQSTIAEERWDITAARDRLRENPRIGQHGRVESDAVDEPNQSAFDRVQSPPSPPVVRKSMLSRFTAAVQQTRTPKQMVERARKAVSKK